VGVSSRLLEWRHRVGSNLLSWVVEEEGGGHIPANRLQLWCVVWRSPCHIPKRYWVISGVLKEVQI
jgi:hypothetical protein